MINVGREFELNKAKWKSYTEDYFIAMATAAVPWLLVAFYYIYILPYNDLSWDKNLLVSRLLRLLLPEYFLPCWRLRA